MDNLTHELQESLYQGFIDKNAPYTAKFKPKLLTNNVAKNEDVLSTLMTELEICQTFMFAVAFITESGLAMFKSKLLDLKEKGVKGRIITSNYLNFNKPKVFHELLKLENVEVRISSAEGFHSKSYIFEHSEHYTIVIGSSNLTGNALRVNAELNIKLTSHGNSEIADQFKTQFEEAWESSQSLTQEWIRSYEEHYVPPLSTSTSGIKNTLQIKPNKMQEAALKGIQAIRNNGAKKGMIVSATGTGKTYLSAFDIRSFTPKRMLFIVHREQILEKAKKDFQKVLGGDEKDFGILSGSSKDINARYLFATIQTISKNDILVSFTHDHFDYILIDEVHKAGATSYHKIIDHFTPKFLLGMTATPERTDGFNIYELFDYNIAYEIRLQEALEEEMLCPFHYFGVTDFTLNGKIVDGTSQFSMLISEERVHHLIQKIEYYGYSEEKVRGLIFCSRTEEAKKLSLLLNQVGYQTIALTGENSRQERDYQVKALEQGKLDYILTVDIFNEGIDIPSINQIVMLRQTQSSIIFIQQLGRGLRKHNSKKYVTIIDFIGNYKNNYLIPIALAGDYSYNKDNIRRCLKDSTYIKGISTINFEEVAKQKVYDSINTVTLDSMTELKKNYYLVKNRINKVPYLCDFLQHRILDPMIIANKEKSYYDFLVKVGDTEGTLNDAENKMLMFLSREILPGIRLNEVVLLKELMKKKHLNFKSVQVLFQNSGLSSDKHTILSTFRTLTTEFYTGGLKKVYHGISFLEYSSNAVSCGEVFSSALENSYFSKLLKDLLTATSIKAKKFISNKPLTRYEKYRKRDVLRMLNWEEQMVDLNIGGYTYKDGKFVIFITLEKDDNFKGSQIAYENKFKSEDVIPWFTTSPRTMNSPEVEILQSCENWTIYIFAKKSDNEGKDYYFLGEALVIQETIKPVEKHTREGVLKNVVGMELRLKEPLDLNLYHYLK